MSQPVPIVFRCTQLLPFTGAEICSAVADTARWSQFQGFAILPGIASASYERRTPEMVGSRIRVANTDGSQHVEEITRWDPAGGIGMRFQEFQPPLSRLASHFEEAWEFQPRERATQVIRTLRLFPLGPLARPSLWLISLFFRQAVARQLAELARPAA